MSKTITEDELLMAMKNPEAIRALIISTEPVFLETIKYDGDSLTKVYATFTRLSKKALFEEGLQLLDRLPVEERKMVIKGLQKLNIPSAFWYKILEENIASSIPQPKNKEPSTMNQNYVTDVNGKNPGDEGYIPTPAAPAAAQVGWLTAFWNNHGGKAKTILGSAFLITIGYGLKTAVDKYSATSSTPESLGSTGE